MTKNTNNNETQTKSTHANKITSLSTFHKKIEYKVLKGMLEYERPEIFIEFCDRKKEIRFVFEKQIPNYVR
jgi:hypothetical protein